MTPITEQPSAQGTDEALATEKSKREKALERAQRQLDQARARFQATKARFETVDRKQDTRRKIILGGLLLDQARTRKDIADQVATLVAGLLRDNDRKAFEGFTLPSPGARLGETSVPDPRKA